MLKQLIYSAVALAAIAPAASADVAPAGDRLYVIGSLSGWDVANTSAVLPKVSDNVYKGCVVADENPMFRFYTALGDWDNNSLGYMESDEATCFDFSAGEFSGNFVEGKGAWSLENSPAGLIELTVDLGANSVEFKKIEVENIWFVSSDIADAASAPNTFDSSNITYSGDLHFHYEALLSNGETCKFGARTYYNAESDPYTEAELWGSINKKDISVSDADFIVKDCSTEDPLAISVDAAALRTTVKRSSYDPAAVQFEWAPDEVSLRAGLNSEWLLSWLWYDGDAIDQNDIVLTISPEGIEGLDFDGRSLTPTREYAGPSVITVTATTPELEAAGVSVSKEFKILTWMPASWVMWSNDAVVDGAALMPVEGSDGLFESTFTVPAGEGDFGFMLTDPSGDLTHYIFGAGWNGNTLDLSSGNARLNLASGNWDNIIIPAEYRGNTYTFRLNCNSELLQVFTEGIDPDKINITPAETNPEFAVSNRNNIFRFYTDYYEWFEFQVEGDGVGINGTNMYEQDGKIVLEVMPWVDGYVQDGTFDIVISRYTPSGNLEECYRTTVPARYVPLESVEMPESLMLHVGEYATMNVVTVPEVCSEDVALYISSNVNNGNDNSLDIISFDNSYYLLAKEEGAMSLIAANSQNGANVYATTEITVMPKEAAVAQHVFHAHMAEGDVLKLKLSSHDSNGYAAPLWLTSNESVATVDQDGNVTATGSGSAVITADCGDHQSVMGIHVGEPSGEISAEMASVKAYGHNGTIYVAGAAAGTEIRILDTKGSTEAQGRSNGSTNSFAVGRGVHLIAVGNDVFKIVM